MRVDGQLINSGAEVVTSLPTDNLFYGREVILSTEDNNYTYFDGVWQRTGGASDVDTFLELIDTPSDYTGQANKEVAVNATEDGISFRDRSFLDALDTPNDYTGQADKQVVVKSDETGLEFGVAPTTFLDLTDTPNDYTGQESRMLVVNGIGTGIAFVDRAVDTNDKVSVSSNDNSTGFLIEKLVAGPNISFTENNDGDSETLTIEASGGGNGGGGVDPASAVGQMIRSTGTLAGEYEWIDTKTMWWQQFARETLLFGDSIDLPATRIDVYQVGDLTVEGNLTQSFTGSFTCENMTSFGQVNGDDIQAQLFMDARDTFFQSSDVGIFDVQANPSVFQFDLNIFGNCDAGSYTQMGVPIAALIAEEVIQGIDTKYEDKYDESITLNSSSDATNILMSYSDLVPGNRYKVNAHLTIKWTADSSGTPNLKYKVKLQDPATAFREVEHEQVKGLNQITTQSWSFTFSFQATEQSLSLIVETDAVDHQDIAAGVALGVGMTVEEFESDVRVETTEW